MWTVTLPIKLFSLSIQKIENIEAEIFLFLNENQYNSKDNQIIQNVNYSNLLQSVWYKLKLHIASPSFPEMASLSVFPNF